MWDLSFEPEHPTVEVLSPNHWTAGELPGKTYFLLLFPQYISANFAKKKTKNFYFTKTTFTSNSYALTISMYGLTMWTSKTGPWSY